MHTYIWNNKHREIQVPPYEVAHHVVGVMPLIFMEHCVECGMPACYKTCMMFEDRRDGRCKRFDFGQQRITFADSLLDGATISFRRWAKLAAYIPKQLEAVDVRHIHRIERWLNAVSRPLEIFSHALGWKFYRPSRTWVTMVDRWIFQRHAVFKKTLPPDGLLAVIYNHEPVEKTVFVELLKGKKHLFYRDSIVLKPGWNEWYRPMTEIPLNNVPGTMLNLYFQGDEVGMLTLKYFDFVALEQQAPTVAAKPAAKVKCVAWDLDNTMWNGVIGDDGPEGVTLRPDSLKLVRQLDEMGVLQTIVSKNNFEIAWQKLTEVGLDEYFLYPAINWGRKSQSLQAIASRLNINIDTFAVIDDSLFERGEISSALPQVRVFDVTEVPELLSRPEFDIPVTSESQKRRESYRTDMKRNDIFASWSGDYDTFLKDCGLRMQVFVPKQPDDVKRCLELIQRSNQYNVSGEKRDAAYMENLLADAQRMAYGYHVQDRYGQYGIVGFCAFRKEGNTYTLTDFVMSCRVAQKKVERAFFNFFINKMQCGDTLRILVNKTARNSPLREELAKMPLVQDLDNDKQIAYHYTKGDAPFLTEDIIEVIPDAN